MEQNRGLLNKLFFQWVRCLLGIVLVFSLSDCHRDHEKKGASPLKGQIAVVKLQRPTQQLYYAGVLAPLRMQSVLSPVEGQVTHLYFSYGQFVKRGQKLLTISSTRLAEQYRKTIADYLEKKSAYANSAESFRASSELYRQGVISKEEYTTTRSQYQLSRLNYYESQYEMDKVLHQAGVRSQDIRRLTLGNTAKVNEILRRQFKSVVIRANLNGIILFPLKNNANSEDNEGVDLQRHLHVGSSVKQEQLLLTIGDLTGLSTQVSVNEVNINSIKKGMRAFVTGSAFPEIRLRAYVAEVSSQARSEDGRSSLSEFPIKILVPHLTKQEQERIHVGMTAKILIEIPKPACLLLPLSALAHRNGVYQVTVLDAQGRPHRKTVTPGFTTVSEVSITKGLRPGDRVVIPVESKPQDDSVY